MWANVGSPHNGTESLHSAHRQQTAEEIVQLLQGLLLVATPNWRDCRLFADASRSLQSQQLRVYNGERKTNEHIVLVLHNSCAWRTDADVHGEDPDPRG